MKVYLGSDHQGFHLKQDVFAYLAKRHFDVEDVGDTQPDPEDDFTDYAYLAVTQVLGSNDDDPRAILICGGGQGMAMAANRVQGIRAAVIWDEFEAKMTRNDNDSNVLCLPSRLLDGEEAEWQAIVDTWLTTEFAAAPRYIRRNHKLDQM